jgi:topoisomerase-4 subunit B
MSTKVEAVLYDEDKIKSLSSLEHIRLRTGMYIGRLGDGSHVDDGIYVLLKEVIDNAIDEYIMGFGKKVEIQLVGEQRIRVRDYGRGIPLGKVIECVSKINTGAKYNDEVFQFSVGLNGVGTKAVNALSVFFQVASIRGGKKVSAFFERGQFQHQEKTETEEPDGTFIEFQPDEEIFKKYRFQEDYIRRRLNYYAFLNSGLTLWFNGERFRSENGLKDLLKEEGEEKNIYEIIHYRDTHLEFAFTHTENYGENFFSFVNGQYTNEGGTHLSAFKEGITKAINAYSKKSFLGKDVHDGILGSIAVKLKNPVFESQTKNKLGNTDIRSTIVQEVKTALEKELHKDTALAERVLEKIRFNEKLRKDLQNVTKEAREKAKRTSIKVPNLRDCKYHLNQKNKEGQGSMIFLTEGQSASGSLVSCRNPETQAVFPLRGKPLNCFNLKRDAIYKNEELYNIMKALGIEEGIEGLRYQKVILATDADVDGLHIRNLLLTFFTHYFSELITQGHIYILETPLYKVRNKSKILYSFDEDEKEKAVALLGKEIEITRFKGLGEFNPKEFGAFIGKQIRLIQVGVPPLKETAETLEFFMGRNTPERRDYIIEHLV